MAMKRMFTMRIVDTDAFLDMPLSAQALYFHLNMRADDDGFVGNPKRVMKLIGADDADLMVLQVRRFVIMFDNCLVIKHWGMHNYIAKDRYQTTSYQDELSSLTIKSDKSYSTSGLNVVETKCLQDVNTDIDKEIATEKEDNVQSNDSLESFFEDIWKLYPLKKGKGQISTTKKKVLYKIGFDEIKRCVERYTKEIKDKDIEKYTMHGSTFFNSGYVDYLDCNYDFPTVKTNEEPEQEEEELVGDDW